MALYRSVLGANTSTTKSCQPDQRDRLNSPGPLLPLRKKNVNTGSPLKIIPGEDNSFSIRKKGTKYRLEFESPVRAQIRSIVFYEIFKKHNFNLKFLNPSTLTFL